MTLSFLSVPFVAAIMLTGRNSGTSTTVAARNSIQLTAAGSSFVYPVMMRAGFRSYPGEKRGSFGCSSCKGEWFAMMRGTQ